MTKRTDTVDPVALHRAVVDALDDNLFEVTSEPIGWRCRQCDGRFALSDSADSPAWRRQGLVHNLVDSAQYHLRVDHI